MDIRPKLTIVPVKKVYEHRSKELRYIPVDYST